MTIYSETQSLGIFTALSQGILSIYHFVVHHLLTWCGSIRLVRFVMDTYFKSYWPIGYAGLRPSLAFTSHLMSTQIGLVVYSLERPESG